LLIFVGEESNEMSGCDATGEDCDTSSVLHGVESIGTLGFRDDPESVDLVSVFLFSGSDNFLSF